jgi:hypothetical protein
LGNFGIGKLSFITGSLLPQNKISQFPNSKISKFPLPHCQVLAAATSLITVVEKSKKHESVFGHIFDTIPQ